MSRLHGSKFHLRYANGLKACGDNMGQQENLQTSDPGDFQKSLCPVKTPTGSYRCHASAAFQCEWFWSSRGGPSCPSAMTQQRMSVAQAGNEEGVWLFRLCWSHDLWSKWSNVLNLLRCQQTCQMRTANARLDDSVALWSQAGTREPGWYSWQASALAIHGNIRNTRNCLRRSIVICFYLLHHLLW